MKEKYLITKTGDGKYEVEKEETKDEEVFDGEFKKTDDYSKEEKQSAANKLIAYMVKNKTTKPKEAGRKIGVKVSNLFNTAEIMWIINQVEKEIGKSKDAMYPQSKISASKLDTLIKSHKEDLEYYKKNYPDSPNIKELEKMIKNNEKVLKEMDAKSKDAKPYLIKFKDIHLEMVGFGSKKEAKEMAIIYRTMSHDATNEEILSDAKRKVNWASLGMKEGMKAKQKLSDNWKHWVKEIEKGNWDVNKTVRELKKTFKTKDAKGWTPYSTSHLEISEIEKIEKKYKEKNVKTERYSLKKEDGKQYAKLKVYDADTEKQHQNRVEKSKLLKEYEKLASQLSDPKSDTKKLKKRMNQIGVEVDKLDKEYKSMKTSDSAPKSKSEWKQIIQQYLQKAGIKGSVSYQAGGMSGEYYRVTVSKEDTDINKLYDNVVYPFNRTYGDDKDYVYIVIAKK